MKIKIKLTLGVGLLFLLIILLAVLGAFYTNALNKDTQNILVANYNTLDYSREMIMALDEDISSKESFERFTENLQKQKKNITEIGEKELTNKLSEDFEKIKTNSKDDLIYKAIRKDLTDIMLLNMQAIQRKSNVAKLNAKDAIWWISISGALCFLIAFILLVNLPGNIANPIKELTQSIKQIAAKNYHERVHFESRDEFGELANSFNTMAEKLQEYNNSSLSKIMFEKKRIETLINNMHDPVIGLDENKMILFVNDEALKILGMKAEELTGKFAQDIALTNDLMRSLVRELMLVNEEKQDKKALKIYADNKESYFEKETVSISITPTGEKEQKHIGHFIVLRNITPFKELDFAKTNFIATVSHELKTPIASIKMSLQLLENKQTGIINEDQQQLIESIKDDSNRLLKITSELLNLSQVETGNIHLNIQKSNPYEIMQYATEAVKIQAEQKQVEIIIQADKDLPEINADTEKTAWVLINFLTNAIRYSTEQSKIIIGLKNDKNKVLFFVKDQGKGIENRYHAKLFDKYFQVPGSNKIGSGLGLAISKEFIEAQGGEIGVNSEIGMGSTFFFNLSKVS